MIGPCRNFAALRGAGGKVRADENEYLHFYEKIQLILLLLAAAGVKCLKGSCDKKRQISRIVGGTVQKLFSKRHSRLFTGGKRQSRGQFKNL
jgi:hypothetical protein